MMLVFQECFFTIETGINETLYVRLSDPSFVDPEYLYTDYIITLDSKDYNGVQFASEIQSKTTAATGGASTTCSYDSQTRKMSVRVANQDINFFH